MQRIYLNKFLDMESKKEQQKKMKVQNLSNCYFNLFNHEQS